nr:two-component sensor histidine kinase [Propionibacterium sp.]
MSPIAAALLGVLAGVLLGAGVMVAVLRRPDAAGPTAAVHTDEVRTIMGVLTSGVVIVGPHDDLLAHNETAERLGLVRGTRIGLPEVLALVRSSRREGEQRSLEAEQTDRLGRTGVRLAIRTLPLDGGRVFVVADDRTLQVRADASSREFMTNATHELKTPIGAVALLSEAIADAADDPDAVTRFAGSIGREAARLSNLVQQILTLSKLQGREPLAAADRLPVDDVVADALGRCRALAEGRSITLTSAGEPGLWVFGDAEQLSDALTNLIQNGINYSDPGARVVVTTRAVTVDGVPWVDLAVSDNGIGIAPADQERIFERFYRVDYARSRETGGTGLGLSIVRQIVEGHGGSVSLWSSPGAGSTFTLRLPATAPQDVEEEA